MAAARKKGKYVGGAPLLGYDIDREASRLFVNEIESVQVRTTSACTSNTNRCWPSPRNSTAAGGQLVLDDAEGEGTRRAALRSEQPLPDAHERRLTWGK